MDYLIGGVPYLGGGLFPPHPVEQQHTWSDGSAVPLVPDHVFEEALAAFEPFTWTLEECEDYGGPEGVVTPALLGTLAEHHIEKRKETGSYYTPVDVCNYIVRETCEPKILRTFTELTGRRSDSFEQLLPTLDARDCGLLLFAILPATSVLDPACGAAD